MNRQESRAMVAVDWAMCYHVVFDQLEFIKDEHAKVRAANGFMVTIDKVLPFNAPTEENGFQTADKLPRAAPPEPKDDKIIPDEHTKPQDAPETIPGEKFTEEGLIGPAYDPVKKRWNYCPECKKTDLEHASGPTAKYPGRAYQACFSCRFYLNSDGSKKDMGPPRQRRGA